MALTHTVTLTTADGFRVDTWDGYEIELDLMAPGSPWTLAMHYSLDAEWGRWVDLQAFLVQDQQVYLTIDGACQLSGVIDEVTEHADRPGGCTLTVSGYDVAVSQAMFAHADPKLRLVGLPLEEALSRLWQSIGQHVFITGADTGYEVQANPNRRRAARSRRASRRSRVRAPRPQPSETVWAMAQRLCKRAGYMLWTVPSPEDGPNAVGLVVDTPASSGREQFYFTRLRNREHDDRGGFEGNVIASTYTKSIRNVPSEIQAFTHTSLADGEDARSRTVVFNTALEEPFVAAPARPRPRYIRSRTATTPAAAERQAQHIIAQANANLRVYECTVQGHGQEVPGGIRIFAPNGVAWVKDDLHKIDENFVITKVHHHCSKKRGQVSTVRMVPLGAIAVYPEDETGNTVVTPVRASRRGS